VALQAVDQFRLIQRAQNHVQTGKLFADSFNHRREVVAKDDGRGSNADPGRSLEFISHLGDSAKKWLHEFEQLLTSWSELKRTPLVKGHPKIPLQGIHLGTDGRLLYPVR